MAERPGFMLYFDTTPALDRLSDVEAGQLFKALLHYAQFGEVPTLDGLAGFAFDLLRPRLDRDRQAYRERCEKNRYVAYSREAKRRGEEPADFETWRSSETGDISSHDVTERDQLNQIRTKQNVTSTAITPSTGTTAADRKGGAGEKKNQDRTGYRPPSDEEFVAMRDAAIEKLAKGIL